MMLPACVFISRHYVKHDSLPRPADDVISEKERLHNDSSSVLHTHAHISETEGGLDLFIFLADAALLLLLLLLFLALFV